MQDWVEKTSNQDINVAKIRSTLCVSPDLILPVRGLLSRAGMADPRVPTMQCMPVAAQEVSPPDFKAKMNLEVTDSWGILASCMSCKQVLS